MIAYEFLLNVSSLTSDCFSCLVIWRALHHRTCELLWFNKVMDMCVRTYVRMYVCMYACMYVCIYVVQQNRKINTTTIICTADNRHDFLPY
jgi:hypothetical protein